MAKASEKKRSASYTAEAIEVLSGLEPVKRRPGMYTDTSRPNHLAYEAIDNSVDEAIAGYAHRMDVILYPDGSLAVTDDGRGMPIDVHPEHHLTGVELILTRLHAGAKFSTKTYEFSGGLHGVGISVVNALSKKLIVQIKKDGHIYQMDFADGEKVSELHTVGKCTPRETGTSICFWPNARYFDAITFALPLLVHTLRAKAVLCPGLTVRLIDQGSGDTTTWCYDEGLKAYLLDSLEGAISLPLDPWMGSFRGAHEKADWVITWLPEAGVHIAESYVNLIPTPQGGTHVNGLRSGLLEALREFCDRNKLLPRG